MNKLFDFIKNNIYKIFIIILGIILLFGNIENGIILTLLSFILIYLFVKKVKIKKFWLFLIIFSLVIRIIEISIIKVPLLADYYMQYNAAQDILNGNLSFTRDSYFGTYGYQLFHVFYEALCLKIWNNIYFLNLLNCIYSTVICLLIYLICKKIVSENTARITSLLYSISLYPIYLNGTLCNQAISLMLVIIAIYLIFTKEKNKKYLIIAGLLLAISNLERPEGIVYICTIIGYFLINNSKFKEKITNILFVIIPYFVIGLLANFIIIKTNINDIGFKNASPEWKFYVGLSYEHSGKYNYEDEYNYAFVTEPKKEIKNRLLNKKLPILLYKKIKLQFLYDDIEETKLVNQNIESKEFIINTALNYIKTINIVIIIFAFYGISKKHNEVESFFQINIIIYFIIYLFIEVNARYYYNPQVSIIILSSLGIEKFLKKYLPNKTSGVIMKKSLEK